MKKALFLLILAVLSPALFGQNSSDKYPKFNWDRIPVYIHFGDNDGLTD